MAGDAAQPQRQAAPGDTLEREPPPPDLPPETPGSGLWRGVAALRHRNYRLFFLGQSISSLGSWMESIGQTWLVLQLTHNPFQLGLVGAVQALPVLLFSLVGGVLADRWPKRRILLWTRWAAMIQAFLLWALVATGTVHLWHVYALALLLGLTNCLARPAGQAFTVELAGRDDLANAVALNSVLSNMTRIVGPGLAGIMIAVSGVAALFLLNALSFIAAIVSLVLIDGGELHIQARSDNAAGSQKTTWQSLREGVSYVRNTPAVLLPILVVGLVLLFGSNFNVVLPVLATDVLHIGARGFGFLSAASGAGSFVASLWLAWSVQQLTIRRVLIGTLVFGVLEAAFAFSRLYPLSLALIAGVSGVEMGFATLAITLLQTLAPDHLSGRVMSVCILFFDGSLPLGYLLIGWLSSSYGAPQALLIGAGLSLLVAGAGWMWRGPAERNAAALAGL